MEKIKKWENFITNLFSKQEDIDFPEFEKDLILRNEDFKKLTKGDIIVRYTCSPPYSGWDNPRFNGVFKIINNEFPYLNIIKGTDYKNSSGTQTVSFKGEKKKFCAPLEENGIKVRGSESFECWYEDAYIKVN